VYDLYRQSYLPLPAPQADGGAAAAGWPWDDGKGLETPIMRRKRFQLEGRQQAQECLEADNEVQQIMKIFEAQWQQDTLELAEKKE